MTWRGPRTANDPMIRTGWFADRSDQYPDQWQVFLQTPTGCYPLDGIWFFAESDAQAFIRSDVVGQCVLPEFSRWQWGTTP